MHKISLFLLSFIPIFGFQLPKNFSDDPHDHSYIVDYQKLKTHRALFLKKLQSGEIPYEKNTFYTCTNCGFTMHAFPEKCVQCLYTHFYIEKVDR